MGGFSPWHLLVVAIVAAVLFFGWKQLPDMARSVGRSLRVFKTEIKGMGDDDRARDSARDAEAEPRQLEPRPTQRPAPQAEIVRPAAPVPPAAPAPQPERARPRPTPNPNGHTGR
ncbi:sec-independent protein translocase protein TatA [Jatrophihabitans endophyticus]|uniref:Sec-independent protein translocase protein TatA n=1 Tax=Jatrophihabitans endophyticus TaxID=1206085 RepID=A0A1M5LW79_9ACTN|nr:Sec-independent protein translocase subunit TatA [Jatrophihabitans endophyticus]SHG69275.1 sec-independent protein translocase protein TatA [Jatrophihabitans endophyticus]